MPIRVLIFLGIATLLVLLLHGYIALRLIRRSSMSKAWQRRARRLLRACSLLVLLSFVVGRFLPDGFWVRPLNWVGFTAMGGLSILFALTVLRDLLFLPVAARRRIKYRRQGGDVDRPEGMTRRQVLAGTSGSVVFGASLGLVITGLFRAIARPEVVRQAVVLEGLPEALDGFTVAQISDLHLGPTLRRAWLEDVVARVNELGADVIAVTGDLIDGRVADLREVVAPIGALKADHGVYFVTGNHEYYWDAEAWVTEVETLGLDVLSNTHRVIQVGEARLLLAGVTDYRAADILAEHATDPAGARAGAPSTDASILLAHQPRSLHAAREAGYDLQLSGHTHGGQFFPWNFAVHLIEPAVAGLYRFGDLQVYVNRGTGYWGPPLRSGARAEITLVELKRPG